jgi:N-acetylglutamate synthase-like GNAT family acetyltransferase
MTLAHVHRATLEDLPRIRRFYERWQYRGEVRSDDTVLIAEQDGAIIGVVRLAPEHGKTVLRGMRVVPGFQRQGIGTRLLDAVSAELKGPCYCIPYAHLTDFYGQIGFQVLDPRTAPDFLAERLASYRARADGHEYLLMYRPAP